MTVGHDIVAIIGASNGLGCGHGPFEYADDAPMNTIYEVIEPQRGNIYAKERTDDPITGSYGSRTVSVGLSISFCRHYAQTLLERPRNVAFVNGSLGGTTLAHWHDPPDPFAKGGNANNDLYLRLACRLRWALANLYGRNRIVALVFQIGENDIHAIENGKWHKKHLLGAFDEIIQRSRRDFGQVPALIGEPRRDWQSERPIRQEAVAAMQRAADIVPLARFVKSDGLGHNEPPDDKHFSAQGMVDFGVRHCDALAEIVAEADAHRILAQIDSRRRGRHNAPTPV